MKNHESGRNEISADIKNLQDGDNNCESIKVENSKKIIKQWFHEIYIGWGEENIEKITNVVDEALFYEVRKFIKHDKLLKFIAWNDI